ncbi:MAG TPA: signal peptidase II [Streptosporangiaceae bacterium]
MQAARGTPLTGPRAPGGGGQPDRPADSGSSGRAGTGRRVGVLVGTALTVLALDIISKVAVVANLSDRSPVRLLGGFLTLLVSRNPGAAFSIGTSMTVVFSVIAVSVIVVILRTSRRIRSIPWAITLGLLLGGATGNLIDRILRYPGLFRGYVVDWIEIPHWPVFNLADSAIVCGGVLAVLLSARGVRLDGLRLPPAAGRPAGSDAAGSEAAGSEAAGSEAAGDSRPGGRPADDRPGSARPGLAASDEGVSTEGGLEREGRGADSRQSPGSPPPGQSPACPAAGQPAAGQPAGQAAARQPGEPLGGGG